MYGFLREMEDYWTCVCKARDETVVLFSTSRAVGSSTLRKRVSGGDGDLGEWHFWPMDEVRDEIKKDVQNAEAWGVTSSTALLLVYSEAVHSHTVRAHNDLRVSYGKVWAITQIRGPRPSGGLTFRRSPSSLTTRPRRSRAPWSSRSVWPTVESKDLSRRDDCI